LSFDIRGNHSDLIKLEIKDTLHPKLEIRLIPLSNDAMTARSRLSKKNGPYLEFDPKTEAARISKFIKEYVTKASASGVVVGISGGIDSAVAAFLAVKAIGRSKVHGLLLFEDGSKNSTDFNDAKALISKLRIGSAELSISPPLNGFKNSLRAAGVRISKITLGNMSARCRMIFLYSFANEKNLLVLGTGDRSEEEIGYFTKFGDGGVDLQPIAHLYKTQVKILAKELGVLRQVIDKPSTPNLWQGHKATDEIPTDYPTLDKILNMLFDQRAKPDIVAQKLGVPPKIVKDVISLHEKNRHKSYPPPSLMEIR
jgi:NAD+ synthase